MTSLNNRLFRHRCHKKQNFLSIKGASQLSSSQSN
ncbi:Uncharacterised protein [Vibrio cholerae]|nr:Uncharacterised protein [Vibrio cholerae]